MSDYNFFFEAKNISLSINLYINIHSSDIENYLLLIGLIPIVSQNNSTIYYKINNRNILSKFKSNFKNKAIENNIIKFTRKDFHIINDLLEIIKYKWEIIPCHNIINIIRHIIDYYYTIEKLDLFDNIVNYNFEIYIKNNLKFLSLNDLRNLMSKISFIYLIIILIETTFIYEKEMCIGRGTTGRVRNKIISYLF